MKMWVVCYVLCSCYTTVVLSAERFGNVALGKSCRISSKFFTRPPANAAVNGNTGGIYNRTNCIHTARGDLTPWWEVNLGRPYPVYNITVWARTYYLHRMMDCVISVDGKECYRFDGQPPDRKNDIHCQHGVLNGTVVRVSKNTTQKSGDNKTINLCEIQVFSCSDPYWGSGCLQQCGHCSDNEVCDKVTACRNDTFGDNCSQQCSEGCQDVCDKVKGHCTCRPGWNGSACDSQCPPGTHGFYCSQNCSVHCDDVCDPATGNCMCKSGYKDPNCTEECDDYEWGSGCLKECGHYNDTEVCDKVTGHYSHCSPARSLPLCDQKADTTDVGTIVGAVAGAVVVAVVAVMVVVIFVIRRRRRKRTEEQRIRRENDTDSAVQPKEDFVYENVISPQSDGEQSTGVAAYATTIQNQAKKVQQTRKNTESTSVSEEGAYENAGIALSDLESATYLELSAQHQIQGSSMISMKTMEEEVEDEEEETEVDRNYDVYKRKRGVYYNDDAYMKAESADLKLDAVQQYLLNRLCSDDMDKELTTLPTGMVRPHDTGAKQENYRKNWFSSILPYDDTRVVLRGTPDPGCNDYINASYIAGHLSSKAYIASQGPKANTVGDFWKMVWQDHVTHIIMLTSLTDGKKITCALYWPAPGKQSQYGSVEVSGREESHRSDWVVRHFHIRAGKEARRQVTQYHYTTWPDHGVPTATALVDFWRTVKTSYSDQQSSSPLLVHCSARVGSTGTFLALDILMDQVQQQQQVDILQTVTNMRHDRCNMIQTKFQYCSLHEALLEAYTSQECRLSVSAFESAVRQIDPHQSLARSDTEYQKLKQMKVLMQKPNYTEAEKEENINKNRTVDVLPDDHDLVKLTVPVSGRNDYINAVYLPTFRDQRGFILTQLPLADTMIDLWRMVAGNDVATIVSLGDMKHFEKDCYWPTPQNACLDFGPITVHLTSWIFLGKYLSQYTLSVSCKDQAQPRKVTVVHYKDWAGDTAGSVADVVHLVQLVLSTATSSGRSVLLQCNNGASRSGLFGVICNVISRMTSEQVVDVYMAVRNAHMVRPQCVTSQVQYRFIYQAVQEYTTKTIYSNI